MSQPRVIQADFANWRPVNGRKVLQLIFEVPIESTHDILTMLGTPTPGESKWCAIALLDPSLKEPNTPNEGPSKTKLPEAPASGGGPVLQAEGGPHKKWNEYARSQQAAILCGDPDFWEYFGAANAINCDGKLKLQLRISSKRELDQPKNHARWDEFVALYNMHRDRLK